MPMSSRGTWLLQIPTSKLAADDKNDDEMRQSNGFIRMKEDDVLRG